MSRHNRDRRRQRGHPKYLTDVLAAAQLAGATGALVPGNVYTVDVRHDDHCALWRGRPCDCEPSLGAIRRVVMPEEN